MKRAPRLWTDVVKGAFGLAAFGWAIDATWVVVDFVVTLATGCAPFATTAMDEPATTPFMAVFEAGTAGFAAIAVCLAVGFVVAAGFVACGCAQLAVGFVASATAPFVFAVDDDVATTWRKNHPGFAPGAGDFGLAGAVASFAGAAPAGFAGAAFAGATFVAFAPLETTGGVTVVFAMRSLNDAGAGAAGAGLFGTAATFVGVVAGFMATVPGAGFAFAGACGFVATGVGTTAGLRDAVTVIA